MKQEITHDETKHDKKLLALNTVYLYIMQFGGYLFSMALIPYQSRILSVAHNSELSAAISVMTYIQLVMQFGFTVSGVRFVTESRDDPARLKNIYTSVFTAKLLLSALSAAVVFALTRLVPAYRPITVVFWLYFIAVFFEAFLPTFFLRGMENMRTVAVVSLLSKAVLLLTVILFVRDDAAYLLIPVARIAAAVFAFLFACIYIRIRYRLPFSLAGLPAAFAGMRDSFQYFLSRVAGSVYHGSNELALGILYPGTLALYTMPQKLVTVAKTVASPLADSFFPYMIRTKNYKKALRLTALLSTAVLAGCVIGEVFAGFFVHLIFGDQYVEGSVVILRILLPIIAITPLSYMITFPVMVPMGLAKHANLAAVVAAVIHFIGLGALIFSGHLTFASAAALAVVSEYVAVLYRVVCVIRHRDRLRALGKEETKKEPEPS